MSEKCGWVRERLPLHQDGELEKCDAAEVDDHLAGCPGCRGEVLALTQAWTMLEAALPPAPLHEKLYENPFRDQPDPIMPFSWWMPSMLGFAAAGVMLMLYIHPMFKAPPVPAEAERLLPHIVLRGDTGLDLPPVPPSNRPGLRAAPTFNESESGLRVVPVIGEPPDARRKYES